MTFTETEIKDVILKAIRSVAPEIDLSTIDPDRPIRDQVDLDSMDFFNIIVRIHEKLGVDIPESDYSRLATITSCASYLKVRTGRAA